MNLENFADKFMIVPRLGLDNTLFCTEYGRPIFTPAFDELHAQAADFRADVLLLDNSAQLFGGDENNRHDVTGFMNGLIGAHRKRAVILASHPSRGAGSEFSGSSAWENAVRTRLYLGRTMPDQRSDNDEDVDDAVRYLARRKANYSARDYRRLTFRDGVLIPDSVEASGGIMGHLRDQQADRVVLEGMHKLAAMGLRMTEGGNSPHFLPRQLLEYKLAEGRNKAELAAAMRRLMMADKIKRATVGHYANRSPMQGLVVAE